MRCLPRVAAALVLAVTAAAAQTNGAPPSHDTTWTNPRTGMTYRFYTGKSYGSDAAFNPVSEVLNEGFDVLGLRGQDRHIFARGFDEDFENVTHSLLRAD